VLSHTKVLEVRQGDGTYVRSKVDPTEIMRRVSHAGILAHFEVRAILEQGAARFATMRRTEEEVEELSAPGEHVRMERILRITHQILDL
jgi:DNA-binding FadR family transcriptional regulator